MIFFCMARKPRIEFEGAFYHVITRGNQRQKIFKDERDYKKYLEILSGYREQYHYRLYAYALMNNHIHLLLETQDIPLSRIQQGINQRYTMYFNMYVCTYVRGQTCLLTFENIYW